MRDHTSLIAWQEAEAVSLGVIAISRKHWRPVASGVFGQVQRSSVSIQANIAEGYAYAKSRTNVRHLQIAYGSAIETLDLLRLLVKAELAPAAEAASAIEHCDRCCRLILGLMKSTRKGLN